MAMLFNRNVLVFFFFFFFFSFLVECRESCVRWVRVFHTRGVSSAEAGFLEDWFAWI